MWIERVQTRPNEATENGTSGRGAAGPVGTTLPLQGNEQGMARVLRAPHDPQVKDRGILWAENETFESSILHESNSRDVQNDSTATGKGLVTRRVLPNGPCETCLRPSRAARVRPSLLGTESSR